VDSGTFASPMRSAVKLCLGFAGSCRLQARHLARAFPGACCAPPRWSWWLSGTGGSILGGCSLCCDAAAGEDFLGPRLVGRASTASPCRPGMHLGDW
jgi:hypothetical protein